MRSYTRPPKQIPGNGLHLGTCTICGNQFYRHNRLAADEMACGRKCIRALIRKKKDADPTIPQYTCEGCGRVFRSAGQYNARCPTCGRQQRVVA